MAKVGIVVLFLLIEALLVFCYARTKTKKNVLFKNLIFILLQIVVITWFVPASYFTNGELSDLGMYRIGFFDFFQLLFGSYEFSYFIQVIILLVSVGALYGVLGKTGKYRALVEKIANKSKGKEWIYPTVIGGITAVIAFITNFNILTSIKVAFKIFKLSVNTTWNLPIFSIIIILLLIAMIVLTIKLRKKFLVSTISALVLAAFAIVIAALKDQMALFVFVPLLLTTLVNVLFKKREFAFIANVALIIASLTSVFNYSFSMFIFIPLLISIILSMGYDKITACVATFGAMLVGTIGSTIDYNITGVINEQLAVTDLSSGIYIKLGIFVFSLAALLFYLSKAKTNVVKKLENKVEDAIENDLFIGEKVSNKYPVWPIITVFAVLFVIMILGCTAWESTFKVTAFSTFNQKVTEFKIKDFTVFKNILGTISAFGSWAYAEMAVMSLLASLLLGRIYGMKHKDMFENMASGAKKMLVPALLIVLGYTVIYFAGNTMFFPTIADYLLNLTSKFNIFFASIVTILGSFLHVDMLYIANYVVPQLAAQSTNTTLIALMIQGLYGVTMFIAPTSALLILGLSYLDIPYKEWVKKTWKLIVALLAIVLISLIVAILI